MKLGMLTACLPNGSLEEIASTGLWRVMTHAARQPAGRSRGRPARPSRVLLV